MVFVVRGSIVQLIVYVIRPMPSGTGVPVLPFGDVSDMFAYIGPSDSSCLVHNCTSLHLLFVNFHVLLSSCVMRKPVGRVFVDPVLYSVPGLADPPGSPALKRAWA